MSRRGRKRAVKVTVPVVDLRDQYARAPLPEQPVAPATVDDPGEAGRKNPRQVTILRMIRDDRLGELLAKNAITDIQFQAGRKWQAAYERIGLGDVRAMQMKDLVSGGGGGGDVYSIARMEAALKLKEASAALSPEADTLVRDVLGSGFSVNMVVSMRGLTVGRALDRVRRELIEALDVLIAVFGLGTGRGFHAAA